MIVDFLVRQRWRISQTYTLLVPIIGLINTVLYVIIAIGVTDVVRLTPVVVSVIVLLPIFIINMMGYILEKVGYFKKEATKNLKDNTSPVFQKNAHYQALLIAYYSQFSNEELKEKIDNHSFNLWNGEGEEL